MKLTDKELKELRKAEKPHYNLITHGQLSEVTGAWDDPGEVRPRPPPPPEPAERSTLIAPLQHYFATQDRIKGRRPTGDDEA
jgi:hypothetical protein